MATSVAITGHTRGIGRGIAEEFKNRNWDVIGFSRSNGFDIAEHDCISRMISVVKENDCDVVVINAYHGFMQIHQLFEFAKLWEHDVNKTIITIGSTSGTEWRRPYPYKYGVSSLHWILRWKIFNLHQNVGYYTSAQVMLTPILLPTPIGIRCLLARLFLRFSGCLTSQAPFWLNR